MKNNESVFPITNKVGDVTHSEGGLTKREYFTLKILLTKPNSTDSFIKQSIEEADLLIKMLKE